MVDVRKEENPIKKDHLGPRGVIEEAGEEIRDGRTTKPQVRQPNRDHAPGDWDRTGDHHHEVTSKADDSRWWAGACYRA